MELYTFRLNSPNREEPGTFEIQDVIENFESLIWTERYYGDSEIQITLPVKIDLIEKLPLGIFLGIDESDELMVLETMSVENNRLKLKGISILSWLNNRFIRTSNDHRVRAWTIENMPPGQILWTMLHEMVSINSSYLNSGSTDIPADYIKLLPIPEIGLYDFDESDDPMTIAVSFDALYNEMRKIAVTYQIGMKIFLATKKIPDLVQPLGFQSYKGLNKTYTQDPVLYPIVRFSRELDSLENVRELKSHAIFKTIAFSYAPNLDFNVGSVAGANAGVAYIKGMEDPDLFSGFNCRALQVFAEDLTGFPNPTSTQIEKVINMLNGIARNELAKSILIQAVDGDIVPINMYQYGRDYNLGDLVELQGTDGVISVIRVTEHILSEEATGEKGYVTYGNNPETISE